VPARPANRDRLGAPALVFHLADGFDEHLQRPPDQGLVLLERDSLLQLHDRGAPRLGFLGRDRVVQ